jgi:hypothetical protein
MLNFFYEHKKQFKSRKIQNNQFFTANLINDYYEELIIMTIK